MMIRSDKSKLLLPGGSESGFTLVEVLVTVLVTSLGLLGLAALQINSVRTGQDAYQYTLATQLAYDVSDRMRANMKGAIADRSYDNFDSSAPSSSCCTTADLDKKDWALQFDTSSGNRPLLPEGKMTIKPVDSGFEVEVTWGSPDSPIPQKIKRRFNL